MVREVIIVEDNKEIREGLAAIINKSPAFQCTGLFGTAEEAIAGLEKLSASIALVDIHLPGKSGIEFIRHASWAKTGLLCVVCTIYEDNDHIFESLKAGAKGYMLKKNSPDQIIGALEDLVNGGSPMNSQVARKVVSSFEEKPIKPADSQQLTAREEEILNLISQGYRYREIGDKLFISLDTVRSHIRNIYGKLQVNSKIAALNKHR